MSNLRDSLGRRSRTRAISTGKRVRLTERDWAWLQATHRHGPLPSSYLLEFGDVFGTSKKRARERLGDLFHEANTAHAGAYLTRPPQQFQTIDSRYSQLVYDLAPAAKVALKQNDYWSDVSGPNGGPWWHRLMASTITSSIELGCLGREDVNFISQSKILERAGVRLSCPVEYVDLNAKQRVRRDLQPDAMFGLEYVTIQGRRFRFFMVEADRSTEPLTSSTSARKSHLRTLRQYEALIAGHAYKKQFKLTAPLLVLFVANSTKRVQKMIEVAQAIPSLHAAALYQDWPEFAAPARVPDVRRVLLSSAWTRADGSHIRIDRTSARG